MRLRYVKGPAVTELRRAIEHNKMNYKSADSWLSSFFGDRSYFAESKVEIAELPELRAPGASGELFELENAKLLHGALKDLSPSQAADERLWVWLAHGPYWNYMRQRWPVESATNLRAYILEHYFLSDARSLVRNGIARLWWFGYSTYDPSAENPYALTERLLHTTDARQSLLERKFWRNKVVLRGVLTRIGYWGENDLDFYAPRERFRRLCKLINNFGGTVLLDALDEKDIYELVDDIAIIEKSDAATSAQTSTLSPI